MTDKQLHEEILAELEFEPEVHPERLGVAVENGVATLTGHVDGYAQKLAVERVVRRVYSARAVVDELEVELPGRDEVSDAELAQAALKTLDGLATMNPDEVRVIVRRGHIRLEGQVRFSYQRQLAETAMHHLRGLRGLSNHITVRDGAGEAAEASTPEDDLAVTPR
jgi:osmotically-inducible protein OsmY